MANNDTKVFRLYTEGPIRQDWEEISHSYDSDQINGIENPDGDQSLKAPTSVPSPFARIDLIRSAFQNILSPKNKDIDGNTIYHRLVSDSLDMAEMFFNRDKYGDAMEIVSWDKEDDLNKLLTSSNPKHKLYGETLALFLEQDAEANNFQDVKRLYILLYNNKIVGGTSPVTLFYTSANDLSFAKIKSGNNIYFDGNPVPLYKRDDPDFIKYIFLLMMAYPNALREKMKDYNDYLEENLKALESQNRSLYNEIKNLQKKDSAFIFDELNGHYKDLDLGIDGNNVKILGCNLKKKDEQLFKSEIQDDSEFLIVSPKYSKKEILSNEDENNQLPLVLQNDFSEDLIYTTKGVNWNRNWDVPYFDQAALDQRILPQQLDNYPYLTVSDFLQPYLIRVPYPLNESKYFNGNLDVEESGDKNKNYLLPLTDLFFDFFDTDELQGRMPDGRNFFEMKAYASSVEVTLRVPIKGNSRTKYVTFQRTYETTGLNSDLEPDVNENKGHIIDQKVSLLIFPFCQTGKDTDAFYRIMLMDTDSQNSSSLLTFYKNDRTTKVAHTTTKRALKEDEFIETNFYMLHQEFDIIELNINGIKGTVIPKFKKIRGSSAFTFAVDFGTTNTHIEYKVGENHPVPFEISEGDLQYATLYSDNDEVLTDRGTFGDVSLMQSHIRHEFIPRTIGKKSEFSFPNRTVIGRRKDLDFTQNIEALADINIPFDYERYAAGINTETTTNLKWSDFQIDNNTDRVEVEKFIEEIILLMRTKVISQNGLVSKTKLIWFYPSSMDYNRINKLEETWQKTFKQYFPECGKPKKMSESLAPFYFYEKNRNVSSAHRPVVSLDIGGGTSDFVIFKKGAPVILSSMRYAANSVFGDGYGGNPQINGFVIKHGNRIRELLESNKLRALLEVESQIRNNHKSDDLIAFFFSLEKNKTIVDRKIPISLSKDLSDDSQLKIVFITFFGSIIYHIAKLMKTKQLDVPENIILTGTGSKIVLLASGGSNLEKLETLTRLIFERVYETKIDHSIELKQEDEPKEITCKGGLSTEADNVDIDDIRAVLLGDTNDTLVSESRLTYERFEKEMGFETIENEVKTFINVLFSINDELNFSKYFGVDPINLQECKQILEQSIMNHLKTGLDKKNAELIGNTNINIEESLFFYPLVGALNELAFKIVTRLPKK